MNYIKWVYKILRSIIFGAVIATVLIFVLLYAAISIPPVQRYIRDTAERELTAFLGSRVMVGELTIRPMNEVIIEDARFYDLSNKVCLKVGRLGAGINLWRLLFNREIEITYVELMDFNADIYQTEKGKPLNIDFIIKAFEPKDKTKPPTKFDLKIHNIVIRGGEASFRKLWQPRKGSGFDPNYISVSDLNADITIPRLSNDDIRIDLRRLSLSEKSGLNIRELKGLFNIKPDEIAVNDFILRLPETVIEMQPFKLPLHLLSNFDSSNEKIGIRIFNSKITPSDLAALYPPLSSFTTPIPIDLTIEGNKNFIAVPALRIGDNKGLEIALSGSATNPFDKDKSEIEINDLSLNLNPEYTSLLTSVLAQFKMPEVVSQLTSSLNQLSLTANGKYSKDRQNLIIDTSIDTSIGNLSLVGNLELKENIIETTLDLITPGLDIASIFPQSPLHSLTNAELKLRGEVNLKEIAKSSGVADISVDEISLFDRNLTYIKGLASKEDDLYSLNLSLDDSSLKGTIEARAKLDGANSQWDLQASIAEFDSQTFLLDSPASAYELSGNINAHAVGNSLDNITGKLSLTDFTLVKGNGKSFSIDNLVLEVENGEDNFHRLNLHTEMADFSMVGHYILSGLPGMMKRTLYEVCPSIFNPYHGNADCGSGEFYLAVKDADQIIDFFKLPVIPLTELKLAGKFDSAMDLIELSSDIPYIQQGNNLITDSYLRVNIVGKENIASVLTGTVIPTKKGLLKMDLDVEGNHGKYDITIDLNKDRDVSFYGDICLELTLDKDPLTGKLEIEADLAPSQLHLNETDWKLEEALFQYNKEGVKIENFSIRHDDQFITISGSSSAGGEGEIILNMAEINVDYIFETLNIPHVTFGGTASGRAIARSILSPNPDIFTDGLIIRNMSYNGAVLGDGDVWGKFDLPAKKVSIGAIIKEDMHTVADVDGGVWIGRDSLAFNFKADRVNAAVVKPFMQAFSSDIKGKASGNALLYGTFSDIDMVGTLYANNVEILIDYINTRYTANDSIIMKPGSIMIPDMKVRDKFGNTAVVNGVVNHRYFHDPSFNFRINQMNDMLVYDTNPTINPIWYGKIFASGAGEISGRPGIVRIAADVETRKGSDFTFVLSDQQEAVKSNFLTFSDKRKEALEAQKVVPQDTVPEFLKRFRKTQQKVENVSTPDVFTMDIRASVNDDIRLNLIMDPVAGDKITAYGNGAMNLTYNSETDEMKLYGKYILDKGTYNFSLQDIILKDFTIKPGSSIAFTGNPYTGILDITAAYRVNTSLTELDNSFASDRELNRTSVPVEALLEVTGNLMSPNIGFDIELPTVTEETAQKVRSIISTDDMMSRQVLYLVALNKFYSPEYMSTSNSGGEWASIATSTLSSQLQNMIGQITDKFTLSPSIKSDKGDFSDLEVDIAMSSQLFNNRLLLNGNFGYRDPSNSNTTFVGDFDLEYLLNNKGTWRLKAYNHFNDQNYYLKSSLTTQGIGIVWRKDFGLPRKKEKPTLKKDTQQKETDTVPSENQ